MLNNNDLFEYLGAILRKLVLPADSRTRLRAELSSYADFHPVAAPAPTARWFGLRRTGSVFAATLLVVAVMGGTTYAAEGTLPGDTLYPIKIRLTEPVQLALMPTVQSKAEAHTEFAERRLSEAEQLAFSGRLDERTEKLLEEKFSGHVDSSLAAADELSASGDEENSLRVRSRLEARLVAHGDILDLIEEHLVQVDNLAGSNQSRIAGELAKAVKLRQEVVRESRLTLERDLEDRVTQTATLALLTKTDAAGSRNSAAMGTAAVPSQVAKHLEDAQEAIEEAKESLENDNQSAVGRAFRKANQAERSSEVAAILMEKLDLIDTLNWAALLPRQAITSTTTIEASATSTDTVPDGG